MSWRKVFDALVSEVVEPIGASADQHPLARSSHPCAEGLQRGKGCPAALQRF
jgi:hypothetical protein